MTAEQLVQLAKVAGLGGLALGVLVLIFREVLRKNIFPTLQPRQGYLLLRLIVILTFSIALSGLIVWVYLERGKDRSTGVLHSNHLMSFDTGWVFAGYYSQAQNGFQEGPYLKVVYRPNSPFRGLLLPELGDILQVIKPRSVLIANFQSKGTRQQLISPPLVHDPLAPGDNTGVSLPAGRLVLVRDVEVSGYPGRPPSVWCRVTECDAQTDGCQKAAAELGSVGAAKTPDG